jgi:hypothetical protein
VRSQADIPCAKPRTLNAQRPHLDPRPVQGHLTIDETLRTPGLLGRKVRRERRRQTTLLSELIRTEISDVDSLNSGVLLPPGDYTQSKQGRHLGQTANLT